MQTRHKKTRATARYIGVSQLLNFLIFLDSNCPRSLVKVNDDLLLQMDTADLIPILYDSLLLTDRQRSHLLKFDEKINALGKKCVERSTEESSFDKNEDSSAADSSSEENEEDSILDKTKLEKLKVKSLITFLRRHPQQETARNELLKALRSTNQLDLASEIDFCKSTTQGNERFVLAYSCKYLLQSIPFGR